MNEHYGQVIVQEQDETEIDLAELFSYYLTKWPIILAGLVAGAVIAGLITFFLITPKYTATAKLYMVSSSSGSVLDLTDLNIGSSLSSDYAELLKVRPILEDIIEEKNLPYDYDQLSSMITLTSITDTRILVIKVVSTSPKEAKVIANALAKKAVKEIPKLMDTSKPNIAEEAVTPEKKSSPSLTKNVLVGGMLGVLLVLAVFTLIFITDDTLNSAEDVEKVFGIMPLTVIPEGKIETLASDAAAGN